MLWSLMSEGCHVPSVRFTEAVILSMGIRRNARVLGKIHIPPEGGVAFRWALSRIFHFLPVLIHSGLYPARLLGLEVFSRQEYWSALPCPPPGDLPNPGIKPRSPSLQADTLPSKPPGKPKEFQISLSRESLKLMMNRTASESVQVSPEASIISNWLNYGLLWLKSWFCSQFTVIGQVNIITKVRCVQLTAGTWVTGFLNSLLHTVSTFRLSFCKSNQVNQYYCDIPPVVALSCSSTYVAEMLILVEAGILGSSAFLVIFISYFYIISTILKIQSAEGKRKAFSTCASHLLVVCLFGGTTIFTYVRPFSSQHFPARDRLISMLYGIITPMLNPMIYSMRNTEVKGAIRRLLYQKVCLQQV